MKIVEFKKGKLLGVNIIDLAVILLVLVLLFSFASEAVSKDLVYSGEQMHNAVVEYQKLDNRGFVIESNIEGKWVVDGAQFEETGLLTSTTGGTFVFRRKNGEIRTIGGSMAHREDIAASKIILKPLDNYLVVFDLDPMSFTNFDEFLTYLEGLKSEIGSDHLYINVRLAYGGGLSFTEAQNLRNQLEGMYLLKDFAIMDATERGLLLNFRRISLEELKQLQIESGVVTTNRMRIFAGYDEEPVLRGIGEYHVISLEELK
ncbi:MAG: hypothetical protein ACE5HY_01955 [Candidatus Hydrothermarchaeales archaeon]